MIGKLFQYSMAVIIIVRPKRDSHGRVHAQSKQPVDIIESHALLLSNDDDDDEKSVKLLDEILAKAQIAHDVTKVIRYYHSNYNINIVIHAYTETQKSKYC